MLKDCNGSRIHVCRREFPDGIQESEATALASTFSTAIDDRYLEDYRPGAIFDFGPIAVDEAEVLSFGRRYDPQIMHTDPEKAADGIFHGIIASGWHTASLMIRLFVDHYISAVAHLASPGVDEIRWAHPVRPGDSLMLRITVLEARPSRTKPDRGIVVSLMEATNQDGVLVCSMRAMNLLLKRPV